ncbi:MAG: SIMPL domain-containing protein [Pseudomonadota bacterium]
MPQCCDPSSTCCTPNRRSVLGCIAKGLFVLVLVCILAGGAAEGLRHFGTGDRYVTVKGLATQDVEADLALWSLTHTTTGTDLAQAQAQLDSDGQKLRTYLEAQGVATKDIRLQSVQVSDKLAQTYSSGDMAGPRYVLAQTFIIRSAALDAVGKAAENIGELVKQGIVLGSPNGGYNSAPQYLFSTLNAIKPDMLIQATKNAKDSASSLAENAGEGLSGIRRATQGQFEILARDPVSGLGEGEQRYKTIRVVVTIDYFLN